MAAIKRRSFVQTAGVTTGVLLSSQSANAQQESSGSQPSLQIAPFRFDVTPPLGHSLCGGWIQPAKVIEDPLEAIGFVLLGAGDPLVICSVDWTGLLNDAHRQWCQSLAQAAGTSLDRVAVQCVHQHDAPFVCLDAQAIVARHADLPPMFDVDFFHRCLDAGRAAVQQAIPKAVPLTHVGYGQSAVNQVASNRRMENLTGRVASMRGSSSRDPVHQCLPEGLIDPYLKSIYFYSQRSRVAACHYYACHPMSYYGRGGVSSDFCGLARKRRQMDQPQCTHIYFNGCGGNIGAGRYNNASEVMRSVLAGRIYETMVQAEQDAQPQPIQTIRWNTQEFLPPPRAQWQEAELEKAVADASKGLTDRSRSAFILSWLLRYASGVPILLSGLHLNDISMLHLPSECFVEYQLRAQVSAPQRFVACAAYGDGGPWYIPTSEAYPQGGYEVGVAWCEPTIDQLLSQSMLALLDDAQPQI
jgi:hypothetical protein